MKKILDLIGVVLLLYGVVFFLTRTMRHVRRIKKDTLTFTQYVKNHPEAQTPRGIKCIRCNSRSIKNWGVTGATDHRRVFICNHCNTRLYRSDGW